MTPHGVCLGLWLLFLVSWYAASLWTAKAVSRGGTRQQLIYYLGFAVGFGLLFSLPRGLLEYPHLAFGFGGFMPRSWQAPLWRTGAAIGWLLVAIEAAAFAFAWWARLHLGRLWSGMLTLREGHRVVDSGPYGLARHPIYTGFILGSWTLALAGPSIPVLAGALVLTVVMTAKAGDEEQLLRRELGADAYNAYAARTPMLLPIVDWK